MEYRIYVNGLLVNICQNPFVLMNNFNSYKKTFPDEEVKYIHCEVKNDEERLNWLEYQVLCRGEWNDKKEEREM